MAIGMSSYRVNDGSESALSISVTFRSSPDRLTSTAISVSISSRSSSVNSASSSSLRFMVTMVVKRLPTRVLPSTSRMFPLSAGTLISRRIFVSATAAASSPESTWRNHPPPAPPLGARSPPALRRPPHQRRRRRERRRARAHRAAAVRRAHEPRRRRRRGTGRSPSGCLNSTPRPFQC